MIECSLFVLYFSDSNIRLILIYARCISLSTPCKLWWILYSIGHSDSVIVNISIVYVYRIYYIRYTDLPLRPHRFPRFTCRVGFLCHDPLIYYSYSAILVLAQRHHQLVIHDFKFARNVTSQGFSQGMRSCEKETYVRITYSKFFLSTV